VEQLYSFVKDAKSIDFAKIMKKSKPPKKECMKNTRGYVGKDISSCC
jgi:hypothetical protein